MSNKDNSEEASRRLNKQIRQAEHNIGYYLVLFLLFFAIPLYVLLQFFYQPADGWQFFDLIFVLVLLAIAVNGIYRESISKTKLPLWFTVLGIISGIIVAILEVVL
jgi:hypothetical protein